MDSLINSCWEHYRKFRDNNFLIEKSIPILYFGNKKEYDKSSLKILTVGLNPSDNEFYKGNSFSRFPEGEQIYKLNSLDNEQKELYIKALDKYFERDPFDSWFNRFEALLNGFNASYTEKGLWKENNSFYNTFHKEEGYKNHSIHIDLCTPLIASKQWGTLDESIKDLLCEEGIQIWRELIEKLQPDIMLVTVSGRYLKDLGITNGNLIKTYSVINNSDNPNSTTEKVKLYKINLNSGREVKVLHKPQMRGTPFGTLSYKSRYLLGQTVYNEWFDNK